MGTSKELLGLEGGGVPTSPEDVESQGGTATDSDDESLVAYDLQESDEEGCSQSSAPHSTMHYICSTLCTL